MTKIQKQRWELYLEIKDFIQNYLGLSNWMIILEGTNKEDGYNAELKDLDFPHLSARILLDNSIIFNKDIEHSFEGIFRLFIHECCHIITGAGSWLFQYEKDNLKVEMTNKQWAIYHNYVLLMEEQMTNTIDKAIMKGISKTKEYKEFKKRFNKIK